MRLSSSHLAFALVVFAVACSKTEAPPSSTPTPSSAASGATDPIGTSASSPPPRPTTEALPVASAAEPTEAPVVDVSEATSGARPSETPSAEASLDAVDHAGVHLGERKHLVASVFGARYCLTAKADDGTAFSACEYESEAAARQGRDKALTMLGALPGKAAAVNKKTVLLVRPSGPSSAGKRALAAFSQL